MGTTRVAQSGKGWGTYACEEALNRLLAKGCELEANNAVCVSHKTTKAVTLFAARGGERKCVSVRACVRG